LGSHVHGIFITLHSIKINGKIPNHIYIKYNIMLTKDLTIRGILTGALAFAQQITLAITAPSISEIQCVEFLTELYSIKDDDRRTELTKLLISRASMDLTSEEKIQNAVKSHPNGEVKDFFSAAFEKYYDAIHDNDDPAKRRETPRGQEYPFALEFCSLGCFNIAKSLMEPIPATLLTALGSKNAILRILSNEEPNQEILKGLFGRLTAWFNTLFASESMTSPPTITIGIMTPDYSSETKNNLAITTGMLIILLSLSIKESIKLDQKIKTDPTASDSLLELIEAITCNLINIYKQALLERKGLNRYLQLCLKNNYTNLKSPYILLAKNILQEYIDSTHDINSRLLRLRIGAQLQKQVDTHKADAAEYERVGLSELAPLLKKEEEESRLAHQRTQRIINTGMGGGSAGAGSGRPEAESESSPPAVPARSERDALNEIGRELGKHFTLKTSEFEDLLETRFFAYYENTEWKTEHPEALRNYYFLLADHALSHVKKMSPPPPLSKDKYSDVDAKLDAFLQSFKDDWTDSDYCAAYDMMFHELAELKLQNQSEMTSMVLDSFRPKTPTDSDQSGESETKLPEGAIAGGATAGAATAGAATAKDGDILPITWRAPHLIPVIKTLKERIIPTMAVTLETPCFIYGSSLNSLTRGGDIDILFLMTHSDLTSKFSEITSKLTALTDGRCFYFAQTNPEKGPQYVQWTITLDGLLYDLTINFMQLGERLDRAIQRLLSEAPLNSYKLYCIDTERLYEDITFYKCLDLNKTDLVETPTGAAYFIKVLATGDPAKKLSSKIIDARNKILTKQPEFIFSMLCIAFQKYGDRHHSALTSFACTNNLFHAGLGVAVHSEGHPISSFPDQTGYSFMRFIILTISGAHPEARTVQIITDCSISKWSKNYLLSSFRTESPGPFHSTLTATGGAPTRAAVTPHHG
jgi:hypothetical protein